MVSHATTASPAPETPALPLLPADFPRYDTVADGVLELKELSESGKIEEFTSRFYATPEGAGRYYADRMSRLLKDHFKDDIAQRLENASELDPVTRERLESLAAHDFKRRAVAAEGRFKFGFEGSAEAMGAGGITSEESTGIPSLGAGASVLTETRIGSWKWYNDAEVEGTGQGAVYRADSTAELPLDISRDGFAGRAALTSEAKLGERAALGLGADYTGVANPAPEALLRSLSLFGNASYAATTPRGGILSAKGSGGYALFLREPGVLFGQETGAAYRHAYGSGEFSWQNGARGLVWGTNYSDMSLNDEFQRLDTASLISTMTHKSDPWRGANLALGFGGESKRYESSLTELAAREGKAQVSFGLIAPFSARISSETDAVVGVVMSEGSLNGSYPEVKSASETLRLTGSYGSVGIVLGANGYSRALEYERDDLSYGAMPQSQIGYSLGPTAQWMPGDRVNVSGDFSYNATDQEGFLPVDTSWWRLSSTASFRLTGENARAAAWLDLDAARFASASVSGADTYDFRETTVFATLTVK